MALGYYLWSDLSKIRIGTEIPNTIYTSFVIPAQAGIYFFVCSDDQSKVDSRPAPPMDIR